MDIEGICSVEIAQSLAVYPLLQMHEPLTHLPLKVQSFGHRSLTMSVSIEELAGFSPTPSLTFEDRFLPMIPPHSFISKEIAEIAKDVSPVS